MPYLPSTSGRGMARLRSVALLETAMKARDINGRELARIALTSAQTVSQLRIGGRLSVRADIARRMEQALRVRRGLIFSIGGDPVVDLSRHERDDRDDEKHGCDQISPDGRRSG